MKVASLLKRMQNSRRAGGSSKSRVSPLNKIPPYTASQQFSRRQRYGVENTLTTEFTPSSFNFAYVSFATATTAVNQFSSIRIRRIEVWAPPSLLSGSGGIGTYATVKFPTVVGAAGPSTRDVEYVATTLGLAECGHLVCSPPKDSLAGMWLNLNDNSSRIVGLQCQPGTIVDITYDIVLGWDQTEVSPFPYTGLVAGPYVSRIFDAGGTPSLVPIGDIAVA